MTETLEKLCRLKKQAIIDGELYKVDCEAWMENEANKEEWLQY